MEDKKERQRERTRAWFAARPEYFRQWTARNREWKAQNKTVFPKYRTGKLPYTINHTLTTRRKRQ